MDRLGEWVSQETLAQLSGETPYAVRWYIFQLREAGYVVESAKRAAPGLFREGTRGWQLTSTQDTPYRPARSAKSTAPEDGVLRIGSRVTHPKFGNGRVTFASVTAPKVVVKFRRRKRVERVERVALVLLD